MTATREAALAGRPSSARTTLLLLILTLCWSLNLMDRQLMAIVAEPIKQELKLSDTQVGLLTGPLFAVLYSFAALPIAWMADHWHRVRILSISAVLWGALTGLSGVATNFLQLSIARLSMSVAEAGCNPCAQSLISDYAPAEGRARALGIYAMGIPLGLAAAGFIGGPLADAYGWRTAFLVLGGVSALAGLAALVILPEPVRKAQSAASTMESNAGFRRLLGKATFRHLMMSSAWGAIASYGGLAWGIIFIARYFGWSPGQAGAVFATLGAVTALVGTWLGGQLADRLARRDLRWFGWMPAITSVLVAPISVLGCFAPVVGIVLFTSPAEAFLRSIPLAPYYALLQRMAPVEARARAAAVHGAVATLFGLGLGPLIVGAASDVLSPQLGDQSLRWGLVALVIPQILSGLHMWRATKTIRADVIE